MADEKWQKIREVFDDALRRPPEARRRYVGEVCGDDKTLLTEVESLLSSLDGAESFMETPAVAKVADVIEAETKKLETGKCFGHYEIVEQIGAGGMGEVYLARDKKLDRQVAVKILNEQFSRDASNLNRFIHEAKAASALNHPNILVIHEIGESEDAHFIVSEFVKGETLRESFKTKTLRLSEVLDISIQIAGALCTAHEARLVHRDIKPENVMIRPDGYVKILDFGLAKLVERKNKSFIGLEQSAAKQNQTAKGVILGTVNYMSPEQAKGERVDERTDIFSFGAVIYEMIAGRTPFAGDSMSATFANLINGEPPPLVRFAANVPDEMQRIVSKTLRKNKTKRYQTMKDALTDLKDLRENLTFDEKLEKSRPSENGNATVILQATTGDASKRTAETNNGFSRLTAKNKSLAAFALAALLVGAIGFGYYFFPAGKTAASVGDKKSIAVLPLQPVNPANRDEIYEVGIADSLIYKLSSMKGFIVRPLSATRKYSAVGQDPIAAGREQQADYVLASNYQLSDGKIRITAQLYNVAGGQIEESYKSEKAVGNIFALQDAIAGEVGNVLSARFATASNSPAGKRGTTNEEAYRLYLSGTFLTDKRNAKDVRQAIEKFEQAIELDPNYAAAYAGLASAQTAVALVGGGDMREQYPKAKAAVEKALAIDDNLSEAHSYSGEIKSIFEWDFAGAEREIKRAVELNPNSPVAHRMYALLLGYLGRFDEAIAEINTAIDLEPDLGINHRIYGQTLFFARRYDEAIVRLKQTVEMDTNLPMAYSWLVNSYHLKGDEAEAFEWFVRWRTQGGEKPDEIQAWKKIYAKSSWRGIVERQLEQEKEDEKNGKPYYVQLAFHSIELGERDAAFAYLEKAFGERKWEMTTLAVNPRFDALRSDPRFDDLVKRVGLK